MGLAPCCVGSGCLDVGIECRITTWSGPTSASLTIRRRIRWRSSMAAFPALSRASPPATPRCRRYCRGWLVVLEASTSSGEGLLADDCRHRDLDPLLPLAILASGAARYGTSLEPEPARHSRAAFGHRGLGKGGPSGVGGIAQHGPHGGAVRTALAGGRGYALCGQPADQLPMESWSST